MSDQSSFQKMDEQERIYAPEQLPLDEQERVLAEEQRGPRTLVDGTSIPSTAATAGDEETPEPGILEEFSVGQGFGLEK